MAYYCRDYDDYESYAHYAVFAAILTILRGKRTYFRGGGIDGRID